MLPIPDLPLHLRPREKMAECGPESLTDVQLLMVIIGSGGHGRPVQKIARGVYKAILRQSGGPSYEEICKVPGMGRAKAAVILAAFELARRKLSPDHVVIRNPRDVLPLVHDIRNRKQEHFVVISLNGNHGVIRTETVTVGLANFCQVHPREVFSQVLVDRGTAVVLAHNHPSNNLEASPEDIHMTRRLCSAAQLLGIRVIDHIIFGRSGYASLRSAHPDLFTDE